MCDLFCKAGFLHKGKFFEVQKKSDNFETRINKEPYSGTRLIRLLDNWASRLIGPNSSMNFETKFIEAYVKWSP